MHAPSCPTGGNIAEVITLRGNYSISYYSKLTKGCVIFNSCHDYHQAQGLLVLDILKNNTLDHCLYLHSFMVSGLIKVFDL